MKKYILLFVLSAAALLADEIPPYSSEFDALAEKPGCTGAQVFARPEWRKFFAAACPFRGLPLFVQSREITVLQQIFRRGSKQTGTGYEENENLFQPGG